MRPGSLRINKVRCHWRYAAPVIDTCINNLLKYARAQIRRRLDVHVWSKNDPGESQGPEQFIQVGFRRIGHQRLWLGPEVLDNDFLDMAIGCVGSPQGQHGFESLAAGLADTDQDAGCERHLRLTCALQCFKASSRHLVGGAIMRHAFLRQPVGSTLEHDTHRNGDLPQFFKLVGFHQPRIQVRKQARFIKHQLSHVSQVRQRGLLTQFLQTVARRLVAQLRFVAEREQRLLAAGFGAVLCDLQHFFWCQVRRLDLPWHLGKRAIVADITAQMGQRDKHFSRVGHRVLVPTVPQYGGHLHQHTGIAEVGKRHHFFVFKGARQRLLH